MCVCVCARACVCVRACVRVCVYVKKFHIDFFMVVEDWAETLINLLLSNLLCVLTVKY
jgi:hypothetical protein